MRVTRVLFIVAAMGLHSTIAVGQDPCTEIVADTIAEVRAGSGAAWTPELARTVKMAAASACVKASSGRYTATPLAAPASEVVEANSERMASEAVSADVEVEADEEESTGFKVTPLSGPPTSKPYARNRKSKDKDKDS